jgi:fermentation-respiration switch protein FrsA (DUF1100 family)
MRVRRAEDAFVAADDGRRRAAPVRLHRPARDVRRHDEVDVESRPRRVRTEPHAADRHLLIAHIDSDLAVPYATAQAAYAAAASPKWLLTFHTGLHPEAYENEPSPHDRTATETSIDFFDLTLLHDSGARARLLRDGTHPGESTILAG